MCTGALKRTFFSSVAQSAFSPRLVVFRNYWLLGTEYWLLLFLILPYHLSSNITVVRRCAEPDEPV